MERNVGTADERTRRFVMICSQFSFDCRTETWYNKTKSPKNIQKESWFFL